MSELIAYIMGILASKPATFLIGMLIGIMIVGIVETVEIYTMKGVKNEKQTNKKRK